MRTAGRSAGIALLVILAVLVVASPAHSATAVGEEGITERLDDVDLSLSGDVTIPDGTTVSTVILGSGNLVVEGEVTSRVFVLNGSATISGTVNGPVIVFRGEGRVVDGGTVTGDLLAETVVVESGGSVEGKTTTLTLSALFTSALSKVAGEAIDAASWFYWVASTVSYALLALGMAAFAPRGTRIAMRTGSSAPWKSAGWGILLTILIPGIAVGLLLLAAEFAPATIGLVFAEFLFYAVGYIVACAVVGALIGKLVVRLTKLRWPDSLLLVMAVGYVILRLLALIPLAGLIITALASMYGAGVIAVTVWRSRRGSTVPVIPAPAEAA